MPKKRQERSLKKLTQLFIQGKLTEAELDRLTEIRRVISLLSEKQDGRLIVDVIEPGINNILNNIDNLLIIDTAAGNRIVTPVRPESGVKVVEDTNAASLIALSTTKYGIHVVIPYRVIYKVARYVTVKYGRFNHTALMRALLLDYVELYRELMMMKKIEKMYPLLGEIKEGQLDTITEIEALKKMNMDLMERLDTVSVAIAEMSKKLEAAVKAMKDAEKMMAEVREMAREAGHREAAEKAEKAIKRIEEAEKEVEETRNMPSFAIDNPWLKMLSETRR